MKVCLVTAFPPSTERINEYGFHLAKELSRRDLISLTVLGDDFADGLAAFAGAAAKRFPWVRDWTPVNEPLTTARFSALYVVWYPHARDDASFVRAVLHQCRATVLAMAAIRRVNPEARLVQTDDLSRTYGTAAIAEVVEFYNERFEIGFSEEQKQQLAAFLKAL